MVRVRDPDSGPALPSAAEETARIAVERAVAELRYGRMVLVDGGTGPVLMAPAEIASPESLSSFVARAGAVPALALTANRAAVLHINPTGDDVELVTLAAHLTPSAIRALADASEDLSHPLMGPFRTRAMALTDNHRAALKLLKLARLLPAGLVSAPLGAPQAAALVAGGVLAVGAAAIYAYETTAALGLVRVAAAKVPLADAENARIIAFRPEDGGIEHLAILIGDPVPHEPVLIRLHSECFTGDLLGSLKCDCGDQLRGSIRQIAAAGAGIVLYLAQEGRGIGLISKLKAYSLQDQGFDTVDANERLGFDADERIFLPAAVMLKRLGYRTVRLMTNNPDKVAGLEALGITVTERVPHAFPSNGHNEFYLLTKKKRSGHYL
ncbi:GTP cyclohydrolase II [Govanella unica]|uniref:GTP cyclohydrolase-2 n=1 Tax=Govanella unica TaxID=2975056 RepID=A0A9X3TVZ5_9PROT|nr:GTP cyclohydrolase II [Govania unica]MDA5192442.1 GTP cyclohydrolase II [Govania unica]